jgi:starvation-inducible outer membrane lipoprotein
MNELNRMILAVLGMVVMMLAGCAMEPSRLEADYGKSVSLAKSNQILDPAAQQNLAPVYGFDGRAATGAIERYQTSFEKPPPPPAFVISVGQSR